MATKLSANDFAVRPLCIYHGNCADGFAAAWVVWKALRGAVDFHAGVYQDPPPDVTGRYVIMVDFSYKRPILEKMAEVAESILILDHHKTAAEDLAGYPPVPAPVFGQEHLRGWIPDDGIYTTFDMNRSGAMITWDHFNDTPAPRLLQHIQDRDLWLFKLDGTREIQASVFSYPYDFTVWDHLILREPLCDLLLEGRAIERKHHKDVADLVGVMKREMNIGGHVVPVANLPYTLTSDAGHLMAKGLPFAACYWDTPGGRVFSLRSMLAEGGVDVSAVAKYYGGGGHAEASGFRMALGWEGEDNWEIDKLG